MRVRIVRWLAAASLLSVIVAGCGPPEDMSDEGTAVSLVGTAVNVLAVAYNWAFDNASGCAIEVVVTEGAVDPVAFPDIVAELDRWMPLILPDDVLAIPVDPAVLMPGYTGSFPWPLTLREHVAPGASADPVCDWLPLDVEVQGPRWGKNAVITVIGERGAISTR